MKNQDALVVLSGGQDSATCLFWAVEKFRRVHAVSFDYGQKHAVELGCARKVAELAKVESHEIIDIKGSMPRSALTDTSISTSATHEINPSLPATFTAARNAVFLSIAAGRAYNLGIMDLITGVCQTDYSGYPDCRNEFVVAMENALALALGAPMSIHVPLMWLTKAETWKMASDLGVVQTIVDHTHTDYNGDHTTKNEWGYGKLDNPASVIRARGYEEAKSKGWL